MDTFTLQATGFPGIVLQGKLLAQANERLDNRRAIEVRLYQRDEMTAYEGLPFVGTMEYQTGWPAERSFLRLFQSDNWNDLLETLRKAAPTVLPPGAGYPATDLYKDRQQKLQGQLEVIALTALTTAMNAARPNLD